MIYDFLIVGAGISGAAAAAELAALGSVLVLEAESAPGYHSTGRSAALFTRNFGGPVVRRINAASEAFFRDPPAGFCEGPLLSPRGAMSVAPPGQEDLLDPLRQIGGQSGDIVPISANTAREKVPYLTPGSVGAALWEEAVADIDVSALHQGFLRRAAQRGARLFTGHRVLGLSRQPEGWKAATGKGEFVAATVVNAAGAWAEALGQMAGAQPIGLVPKRRTAILIDAPPDMPLDGVPLVEFADSGVYIKPEGGQLMASPADATPTVAQDVQPEEMDVAVLADWIERNTDLPVRRIHRSWAGLRSFVADDAPVVGPDSRQPGFFWLAGQGGYGIMMAPALAAATAGLIGQGALPEALRDAGLTTDAIAPERLLPA